MSMNLTLMERELRVLHNYVKKHLKNSNENDMNAEVKQEIDEKINTLEDRLATLEAGTGATISRYNINMNPVASKLGADSGVDDVLAGLNMAEDDDLIEDIYAAENLHEFVKEDDEDITKDLLFTCPRPIDINDNNYTVEQLKTGDADARRRYVAQYILADPTNQIRALYALSEKMKYILNPDYIYE